MDIFRELGDGFRNLQRGGRNALRGSFATAASFFRSSGSKDGYRRSVYLLVRLLLSENGSFPGAVEHGFRRLLEDVVPDINAERAWRELIEMPEGSFEETAAVLKELQPEYQSRCIAFIQSLLFRLNSGEEIFEQLKKVVLASGADEEKYDRELEEMRKKHLRRERMFRSGAGIIAALIVLAVFIITATLLSPVIFGLILAYLLLPLERYFEKSWRTQRGFGYMFGVISENLTWLPCKLASVLKRRSGDQTVTPEQQRKKDEQRIIARAVGQTVFAALFAAMLFAGGIYAVTTHYLRGSSIKTAAVADGKKTTLPGVLDNARNKLMGIPAVKYVIDKAEKTLRDEQARQELVSMMMRRSGGVFSFLFNIMGFIGTLIFDLLLTVFFALLFLIKMAEYGSSGSGGGNYAVRTILVSNWLPNVSESTLSEAQRILGGVFSRLRVWVRGYLTLVLIDSTVYTVLFGILDVPYFPVCGIIAGCGILLPYVGPIFSCVLTLSITWLAGDANVTQLLLITCCYLLYNGIIEQFILYPLVIGESLGLSTLETIIVVLLGAIFAGITGMILALPAASVIKYLVPQIYRCWDIFRGGNDKDNPAGAAGA